MTNIADNHKFFSLPTKYNGFQFRSRTEAKWAVFFDEFGVKYNYEDSDFVLKSGARYLPDFFVPKLHAFFEVKGGLFTEEEKRKCFELCEMTKTNVVMLDGPPDFREYYVYSWEEEVMTCAREHFRRQALRSTDFDYVLSNSCGMFCDLKDCEIEYCGRVVEHTMTFSYDDDRIWWNPGFWTHSDRYFKEDDWQAGYRDCVYKSRSTKFEFLKN
jgi:hypothetical protein